VSRPPAPSDASRAPRRRYQAPPTTPRDGNYWILHLDPEYRSAVVGTGDRRYLWILAREPLPEARYLALVEIARRSGFDVSRLVRAEWEALPPVGAWH
jgi:apolipoprotein D and lipocalin family protein